MCQAKSSKYPNGKRCLKHSKVSQYVIRVVMQRYGVDERTASSMLSELDKEGKHLPMASAADAQAFLDEKRFETATDGEISEHERLIRMNQLAKAKEEAKDGVAGSRLYAWKNLAKRVGQRLRQFAVIGFLAPTLVLTSCSAGNVTPSPSTTATGGAPTTSQTATPSSSTPSASTPASTTKTLPGNGKVVTDKYGSYEHVAPVGTKYNPDELIDNSWKTAGFSLNEVKSARKFVTDFVTTQAVDSSAADGDASQWKDWVQNESSKYISANELGAVTEDQSNGKRSGVIFSNPKGAISPTTRDGGVRLTKNSPFVNTITGYTEPYKRLQVEGNVIAAYRVSPESAIAALKKARPKATEAELRKQFPKAFNAKEDKLTLTFDFIYSVRPDGDSWKITGYSTTYKTEYAYN